MTTPTTTAGHDAFIAYLAQLAAREDRAALATLRRGLGKPAGTVIEMFPYVIPFVSERAAPRRQEDYFLVASLFAAHQISWHPTEEWHEPTNLGASFRRLRSKTESASVEKRFVALLNAERENLPDHLRHAMSLLKAHDIPVDWERLLHDLAQWDAEHRWVQRAWAKAFWRSTVERTDQADQPDHDTPPAT